MDRPYVGDVEQRQAMKELTSILVGRYINGIELVEPGTSAERFVKIDPNLAAEVTMLKELTWHYVIRDPGLATQQEGQRHIIRGLFETYFDACEGGRLHLLPPRYREIALQNRDADCDDTEHRVRLVCDIIAGMTEQEAVAMYHRVKGIVPGSAFSSIVR